jgi:hypothetical protein
LLLAACAIAAAGCTERLTTPGGCPALCPGGEAVIRDTVIDALVGVDSSFTGFTSLTNPISLPLSEDPALGEARGVIRFNPRGDSVIVADTSYQLAIDSIVIRLGLQDRDPTATNLRLEVYRLDSAVDSLVTWDELSAQMVPDRLLRTVSIADDVNQGPLVLSFTGGDLAQFAEPFVTDTRLVIGLRLTATTGRAAAYIGATRSGDAGPFYQTWVTVPVEDTTLQTQLVQRAPAQNFTVQRVPVQPGAGELLVGGFPAGRALIRFALPAYLRDSAAIVRATLELDTATPLLGIGGDSTRIDANAIFADFGAKSVVYSSSSFINTGWIHTGDSHIAIEVTQLVRLWQGQSPLPAALRISHGFEWSSFLNPLIISTRSTRAGAPRIRITYRPPFAVRGF